MDDLRIGRIVRALRQRLGWTQADLGRKAGVSQQHVSRIERGQLARIALATLRRVGEAVELRLALDAMWRGPSLDQLLDFDHARLAQQVKRELERLLWLVEVEVTFSRYGERGSIDLLAYHAACGVLLVIEIKTILPDLQAMLRSIDVKVRLAGGEASRFGWRPTAIVPCLVLADGSTNRRRLEQFSAILARFAIRGHQARRWLREPSLLVGGSGLLLVRKLSATPDRSARRAGRQRVRLRRSAVSVESPLEPPLEVPIRA
jgi:transcriptional regulator with XRE-family HTH domain